MYNINVDQQATESATVLNINSAEVKGVKLQTEIHLKYSEPGQFGTYINIYIHISVYICIFIYVYIFQYRKIRFPYYIVLLCFFFL